MQFPFFTGNCFTKRQRTPICCVFTLSKIIMITIIMKFVFRYTIQVDHASVARLIHRRAFGSRTNRPYLINKYCRIGPTH